VSPAGVAEVPAYAGHRWAEPDRDDLVAALREAHDRPEVRRARGLAAAERATHFDHRLVAGRALARIAMSATVAA
jgi:hypothetical protein